MIRLVYIIKGLTGQEYIAYEENDGRSATIRFASLDGFRDYISKHNPEFVNDPKELPDICRLDLTWGGRSLVKTLP